MNSSLLKVKGARGPHAKGAARVRGPGQESGAGGAERAASGQSGPARAWTGPGPGGEVLGVRPAAACGSRGSQDGVGLDHRPYFRERAGPAAHGGEPWCAPRAFLAQSWALALGTPSSCPIPAATMGRGM